MALTQVPVSMVDFSVNPTLSGGTTNGVAYLNGSKVVTTGSSLTFDGTNAVSMGSGGSSNTATSLTLNATDNAANGSYILGKRNGSSAWLIGDTASSLGSGSGFTSYNYGTAPWIWYLQTGGEQMRLTSTGLGIGTSSPSQKLTVSGSAAFSRIGFNANAIDTVSTSQSFVRFQSTGADFYLGTESSTGGAFFPGSTAYAAVLYNANSTPMHFYTNAGLRMTLDSSGNLGIGTSSPSTKLHIAGNTFRHNDATGSYGYTISAATNTTTLATLFGGSSFAIQTGASGTNQFLLDASGNLGIGTSSPATKLQVYGTATATQISIDGTGRYKYFEAYASGTRRFYLGWDETSLAANLFNDGAHPITFGTSGTERARIDSSGNLLIGTTSSDGSRLRVYGSYQTLGDGSYEGLIGKASSLVSGGGAGEFAIRSSSNLLFATNGNTERARITSGGEVYIAGTTDQGAYNLQVNGTGVWGAGAYVNGSDARLKEEVQDLAPALDVIASLRPVTFRYKEDYSKDQNVQPGFIAQELQTAMAGQAYVDGVIQSGPQHLNVAYQSLIPLLTKAIQELKAEFDAYKATHP